MIKSITKNVHFFATCFRLYLEHVYHVFRFGNFVAKQKGLRKFAEVIYPNFSKRHHQCSHAEKQILFQDLKLQRGVNILEIGIGEGVNFEYYPLNCTLIAVDPNKYFEPALRKNLEKYPNIHLANLFPIYGEDMSCIQSGTIDLVIAMQVHCSVINVNMVLKEISRVLKPGGKYYFMEHVLDHNYTFTYFIQYFVSLIGLWKKIFAGCSFKNIEKEIDNCNCFSRLMKWKFSVRLHEYGSHTLMSPHIAGVATK